MIGIKVNGIFLDLKPDTEINLKLASPIFADGNIIRGSYSLPFQLPFGEASPRNSLALDHHDVIPNAAPVNKVDACLFLDGNVYKNGKLVLGEVTPDVINVTFQFGISTLAADLKELKVNEAVNFVKVLSSTPFTKRIQGRPLHETFAGPFTMFVNGKEYTGANTSALVTAINANTDEPLVTATYYATGYLGGGLDYFEIEPQTDPDVLESPFTVGISPEKYTEWDFNTDDFNAEYNTPIKASLDAYLSTTPPDDVFRFPMVKNEGLYDDKIKFQYGLNPFPYQNYGTESAGMIMNKPIGFYFSGKPYVGGDNKNSITPMVRLQWLLQQLAIRLGTTYEGDFLDSEPVQKALLYHYNAAETAIPFGDQNLWLATKQTLDVKDYLPEMKVPDLYKELQKRFNLAIYVNDITGRIRIKFRDPILSSDSRLDITSKVSPMQSLESMSLEGIRLESSIDDNDDQQPDDFYETGTVEDTIESKFSGMNTQVDETPLFSAVSFNIPTAYAEASAKIPLRLCFYEGRTATGFTFYYKATKDAGSVSWTYDGPAGLKETYWNNYVRFLLRRRLVKFQYRMDLPDLLSLDWEQIYKIDGNLFLINDVDVTLTMTGIKPAMINLYTL